MLHGKYFSIEILLIYFITKHRHLLSRCLALSVSYGSFLDIIPWSALGAIMGNWM